MAVLHDYKCAKHGYFEARAAKCPMKDCDAEVLQVFLQAPNVVGDRTKQADKNLKQLAMEFGMSDIKSTREGEHQSGYLTRNNKFSETQYQEAEKFAARNGQEPQLPAAAQTREARPGDAAIWGGGMKGMNMQSILAGRFAQSVKGESVGLTPSQAGINSGPRIDPKATLRDPENLKIKE